MLEKFGKYEILNKIATGGMAEVYRAKITGEKGFEKLVVIKKVLPHLAAEEKWIMHFTDEAKLAALLQHENIVHVYDFGKIDDSWYITMEYLSGMDLKNVITTGISQSKRLETETVLHIMKGICDGLEYAHALKDYRGTPLHIIHRDISPQNIFITFDGKVKIIDFGIAKAAERSVHTQAGTIKGKLAYMAPEHAEGKPIDHRADIFSSGILFYEMLTGVRMYKGAMADILMKVVRAEFKPASELLMGCPAMIIAILDKALARNPEDRYSSAGEMAADIEACLYDLDLRAGSKHLAATMSALFPEEYSRDAYASLTTLDLTRKHTTAPDHDKTKVLVPGNGETGVADLPADKPRARSQSIKQMAVLYTAISERVNDVKQMVSKSRTAFTIAASLALICLTTASVVVYHQNTKKRLAHYLVTAQQRLEEGHLTEPPEDSASYYYQKALEIDDDNTEAKQGITDVVQKKIERAEMMLDRFRHQAAMVDINDGLALDPENKHLLELKQTAEKKVGDRVFGGFKALFKSSDTPDNESE